MRSLLLVVVYVLGMGTTWISLEASKQVFPKGWIKQQVLLERANIVQIRQAISEDKELLGDALNTGATLEARLWKQMLFDHQHELVKANKRLKEWRYEFKTFDQ